MKKRVYKYWALCMTALATLLVLGSCGSAQQTARPGAGPAGLPRVVAVESFLADIAQNVAGERLQVETLIPLGVDPHAFEPTPQDVARVGTANVLIVNGAGYESWLDKVLENAGGQRQVIEASAGLASRDPSYDAEAATDAAAGHDHAVDPHFWLDPTKVVHYVETIRDGLSTADPAGKETYVANAAAYIVKLNELDGWIKGQIEQIPPARRLLVTNHESLGYFADRYGLKIVGAVVPSVTTEASPSAQQLAALSDQIRSSGAPAVFLETGANAQLAQQLHDETGITVVTDIAAESLTGPDGKAPNYLEMMRYNTEQIVAALK
jgi:ABC-type Zn uptake system ZnuABC Zn-binding protein ZnuA